MNRTINKLLGPIMRIFKTKPTYDPRTDPDIRDVAERQNAAIKKIFERRGTSAPETIFHLMTEESWASPDDPDWH